MFAQQTVFTTDGVQRKVFKDTGSKERYGVETKVVSTKMVFTNGGFKGNRVKMKGIGVEMKGIGVGNKICGQSDGVKTGWFSQQTGPNDRVWEWKKSTGVNKSCFHNRWGQKELFSQQTGS